MANDWPTLTCCQRATPEEVAEEPDAYQCEACPRRLWQDRLGDVNREALALYDLLARRVVHDLHLVPVVFEAAGLHKSRVEVLDLLDRLAIIHEARQPVTIADLAVKG